MIVLTLQTPEEFELEYARRLELPKYDGLTKPFAAGVAYDAAWAIAVGLNITLNKIQSNDILGCESHPGKLVPLEKFNYSNDKMGCVLVKSFSEVNFTGITVSDTLRIRYYCILSLCPTQGQIMFDSNGGRHDNQLNLQQYKISGVWKLATLLNYFHFTCIISLCFLTW